MNTKRLCRGCETGLVLQRGTRHVRARADAAEMLADFIRRMAAWLARREVIEVDQ